MTIVCLYHANCADGFFSALAVYLAKGASTGFIPVHLNRKDEIGKVIEQITKYTDIDEIYFVDLIGPGDLCIQIAEMYPNAEVFILDHHPTSMNYLMNRTLPLNMRVTMDLEHSGAVICHHHFNLPKDSLYYYFQLIEDYDLWKFKMFNTAQFTEAIIHLEFTKQVKTQPIKTFERLLSSDMEQIVEVGIQIVDTILEKVKQLIQDNPPINVAINIEDREFRCKYIYLKSGFEGINYLGNQMAIMAQEEGLDPVGIIIQRFETFNRGYVRSLTDSSMISEHFKGGGHFCSSGFSCSNQQLKEFVPF